MVVPGIDFPGGVMLPRASGGMGPPVKQGLWDPNPWKC